MRVLLPVIAALVLAGCGGSSGGGASGERPAGLPAVDVLELNSGSGRTDLATLRPAGKPLLVWFWAPY